MQWAVSTKTLLAWIAFIIFRAVGLLPVVSYADDNLKKCPGLNDCQSAFDPSDCIGFVQKGFSPLIRQENLFHSGGSGRSKTAQPSYGAEPFSLFPQVSFVHHDGLGFGQFVIVSPDQYRTQIQDFKPYQLVIIRGSVPVDVLGAPIGGVFYGGNRGLVDGPHFLSGMAGAERPVVFLEDQNLERFIQELQAVPNWEAQFFSVETKNSTLTVRSASEEEFDKVVHKLQKESKPYDIRVNRESKSFHLSSSAISLSESAQKNYWSLLPMYGQKFGNYFLGMRAVKLIQSKGLLNAVLDIDTTKIFDFSISGMLRNIFKPASSSNVADAKIMFVLPENLKKWLRDSRIPSVPDAFAISFGQYSDFVSAGNRTIKQDGNSYTVNSPLNRLVDRRSEISLENAEEIKRLILAPDQELDTQEAKDKLKSFWKKLLGSIPRTFLGLPSIVRTSSPNENVLGRGIYHSSLVSSPHGNSEIEIAIRESWASLFNLRGISERKLRGFSNQAKMSVFLNKKIDGVVAGTAHITETTRGMRIEISFKRGSSTGTDSSVQDSNYIGHFKIDLDRDGTLLIEQHKLVTQRALDESEFLKLNLEDFLKLEDGAIANVAGSLINFNMGRLIANAMHSEINEDAFFGFTRKPGSIEEQRLDRIEIEFVLDQNRTTQMVDIHPTFRIFENTPSAGIKRISNIAARIGKGSPLIKAIRKQTGPVSSGMTKILFYPDWLSHVTQVAEKEGKSTFNKKFKGFFIENGGFHTLVTIDSDAMYPHKDGYSELIKLAKESYAVNIGDTLLRFPFTGSMQLEKIGDHWVLKDLSVGPSGWLNAEEYANTYLVQGGNGPIDLEANDFSRSWTNLTDRTLFEFYTSILDQGNLVLGENIKFKFVAGDTVVRDCFLRPGFYSRKKYGPTLNEFLAEFDGG